MALTTLEIVLISAVAALTLSDVGLITVIGYLLKAKESVPPSACDSLACISAVSNFYYHMNVSTHPCIDFYEFACGKFLEETVIPDEETSVSTFTTLTDEVDDKIRAALLEPYEGEAPKYEILLKKYFRTCMDLDAIEKDDLTPMLNLLKKFGGWPMITRSWNGDNLELGSILGRLVKIGAKGLIKFSVGIDPSNSKVKVPTIEQGEITFPNDYYQSTDQQHMIRALTNYIKYAAKLLSKNSVFLEELNGEVKALIEFETLLAEIIIPPEKRVRQMQTNDTEKYLEKIFAENLDFEVFFGHLFEPRVGKGFKPLGIKDVPYFDKLAKVLRHTSKRIVLNYLMWRLIISFSAAMPHSFQFLEAKFLSVTEGVNEAPARWTTCIAQMKMRMFVPLGALYVKHHFSRSDKEKLLELITELMESLRTLINDANWLHSDTKSHALKKLNHLRNITGYPDYYDLEDPFRSMFDRVKIKFETFLDLNILVEEVMLQHQIIILKEAVDYQKVDVEIAVVDAFYSPEMNLMVFPAGILQFPFFSASVQMCINFGGIGYVIGHEITHGFDSHGKQYDKDGNSVNWWKEEDESKFGAASQCFIDQYSKFVIPSTKEKVNGELTLGENIADNGGVRASFMAYKRWVKKHGEELKLPGLDLTPEQLFFLNVGRVHCSKTRPEVEAAHLRQMPHTPSRFRVNGVLKNMIEFGEVYKCPEGSPMNPIKKCRLW